MGRVNRPPGHSLNIVATSGDKKSHHCLTKSFLTRSIGAAGVRIAALGYCESVNQKHVTFSFFSDKSVKSQPIVMLIAILSTVTQYWNSHKTILSGFTR